MKCFVDSCTKTAPYDTLYRINPKGVTGIWACYDHKHYTDKKPDLTLDQIIKELEHQSTNGVMSSP